MDSLALYQAAEHMTILASCPSRCDHSPQHRHRGVEALYMTLSPHHFRLPVDRGSPARRDLNGLRSHRSSAAGGPPCKGTTNATTNWDGRGTKTGSECDRAYAARVSEPWGQEFESHGVPHRIGRAKLRHCGTVEAIEPRPHPRPGPPRSHIESCERLAVATSRRHDLQRGAAGTQPAR